MKVEHYCVRNVAAISAAADVVDAARLMRERHVGFLVVFREGDALRSPIGVVTDRDIVLQVTAKEVDPRSVTVEDVMTPDPVLMASKKINCLIVVVANRIAGIVTTYDLLDALARNMRDSSL